MSTPVPTPRTEALIQLSRQSRTAEETLDVAIVAMRMLEFDLAAARNQPCPFVIQDSKGTSHCSLAERDGQALAKEREKVRVLRDTIKACRDERPSQKWQLDRLDSALAATEDKP